MEKERQVKLVKSLGLIAVLLQLNPTILYLYINAWTAIYWIYSLSRMRGFSAGEEVLAGMILGLGYAFFPLILLLISVLIFMALTPIITLVKSRIKHPIITGILNGIIIGILLTYLINNGLNYTPTLF